MTERGSVGAAPIEVPIAGPCDQLRFANGVADAAVQGMGLRGLTLSTSLSGIASFGSTRGAGAVTYKSSANGSFPALGSPPHADSPNIGADGHMPCRRSTT